MSKITKFLILALFLFHSIHCFEDGVEELYMEHSLEFREDSTVVRNYFEDIKRSSTNWKKELEDLGESFIMFYLEDSDKSKELIPKFDRSAYLNGYPSIKYVAVNCKVARHFCRLMDITGVPTLYYVQNIDNIYHYTSHYLHKHFQVFFRGNWKNETPKSYNDFIEKQKENRRSDTKLFLDFEDNFLHIDNSSFDKLATPNTLFVLYSKSSSTAKDTINAFNEIYEEVRANNTDINFIAASTQGNTESIVEAFPGKYLPQIFYINNQGNYLRYKGQIKKQKILDFVSGNALRQFDNKAVDGNINDKLKLISEIEEKEQKEGTRAQKRKEQEEAKKIAFQKIKEKEEQRFKERQEQQQQDQQQEQQQQNQQQEQKGDL